MGEITGKVIGGGTPKTCVSEYWDGDIPWIQSSNVQENEMFDFDIPKSITQEGLEKSAAKLVPENSIAVVTHVGVGKLVFVPFSYTTSQDFTSLSELKTDAQFTCYSLYQRIKNDLHIVQGSAIKGITKDDLLSKEIMVPEIQEQRKIGNYFRKLDNLITLHQRKLDTLKKLKKGFLQKMFPKNGESVPEIRFPGFTDAWEQRKVSDLLEERNEQAPESAEYPLMAFIANEGVAPKGERYDRGALVKDAENKNYKKTELGDFIYSSNNLETGSIGLNNYGNASISPVYSIFRPTGIVDSDFIGRRFVRKDFINSMVKWRQGVVYGQWRIHESDFLKIEVAVPSLEEQMKIGSFLDKLDNLITLHQRKLDTLKKFKQGMLQQMFI